MNEFFSGEIIGFRSIALKVTVTLSPPTLFPII